MSGSRWRRLARRAQRWGPPVDQFHVLAGLLFLGGAAWGVLLLMPTREWTVDGVTRFIISPFGAGYAVTVGYAIRMCMVPGLIWRRVIWGASCLVQGAWLGVGLWDKLDVSRGWPFLAWWGVAFAVSVYGLVANRRVREPGRR